MKITGDFENALVKMIKEETLKANDYDELEILMYEPVEIYEVEQWYEIPTDVHATAGYSEYFTTLDEAKQYFDKVAFFIINDVKCNDLIEAAKVVCCNEGCTLRKLKFDLLLESPVSLDKNIEQVIQEVTSTKTVYN